MSKLIALTSPAMGAGKSLVARHLVENHGFVAVKFAEILKNMIRSMLRDIGYDDVMIERWVEGDLKENVIPGIGCTPRHLMQKLGTEWGRDCIRPDLWVHLTGVKVQNILNNGFNVVIDDMRFENEFDMVIDMGGLPVRIIRPGTADATGHASEGQLANISMRTIINDLDVDHMRWEADRLATALSA